MRSHMYGSYDPDCSRYALFDRTNGILRGEGLPIALSDEERRRRRDEPERWEGR